MLGIDRIIENALLEDIHTGDITTLAVVPEKRSAGARLIAKESMVLAGIEVAARVFILVDPGVNFAAHFADGAHLRAGDVIADVTGDAASLLQAERVAMRMLERLGYRADLACDGAEAVALVRRIGYDVVLMDVQMPVMNGVEATAALCAAWPEARVVILTTFDRDDYVFQAIRAGAMGYLLKDAPTEDLISTIRRVAAGEAFIQPEIASRTLRELLRPQQAPLEPLSDREREVLVLLAQGGSNREIADRLVISEGTVKNHVSNILGKLQAENRTQAAELARRYGLA